MNTQPVSHSSVNAIVMMPGRSAAKSSRWRGTSAGIPVPAGPFASPVLEWIFQCRELVTDRMGQPDGANSPLRRARIGEERACPGTGSWDERGILRVPRSLIQLSLPRQAQNLFVVAVWQP